MSASSVTPKNRDTIYDRIFPSFLIEGNNHLLFRNFALGKDWDKNKVHFQYLYLNLLCNFSCDVEYYFNEKIKDLSNINCKTKVSLEEVDLSNSEYSVKLEKTDNLILIECLLKDIATGVSTNNNNISKTIYVYENNLIGYSGTLEEKISAYVTSLGYTKEDIDADIWIEYVPN